MKVSIGVSNRHVHLTLKDLKLLFGEDYVLEKRNNLNQPNQFASTALVTIQTDFGIIENVRVLGPVRDYTQIEISKTDAYKLKINPPVRDSGDLANSETVTLIGPKGSIKTSGCIIATRHIHILPSQVKMYGLENRKMVNVKLNGQKGGIIENVHLKVSEESFFELHLDTDDANAHLVKNGDIGEIV